MKLFILAELIIAVVFFGAFTFGKSVGEKNHINTPEYQKRIDILKRSCIKTYRDKEGFTRYTGCRLGASE